MSIALTTDQEDLLASGQVVVRTLVDFFLDSGTVSFWDGDYALSSVSTYLPISDFGEISNISMGVDLGAEGIECRLNGTKLLQAAGDYAGDPGALFGTIESENYQLRRFEINFAFFDAESGDLVLKSRRYAGFIDQIRQVEEISNDGRIEAWLIVSIESIARRYGNAGGRTRSHDDQQDIHTGDTFFKYVSSSVEKQGTLYWGREAPKKASSGGLGGVFGGGLAGLVALRNAAMARLRS